MSAMSSTRQPKPADAPLPCPFCAGTSFAILDRDGRCETDEGFATGAHHRDVDRAVFCAGCEAWGPMLASNVTAIAGWNVPRREEK